MIRQEKTLKPKKCGNNTCSMYCPEEKLEELIIPNHCHRYQDVTECPDYEEVYNGDE